MVKAAHSQGLTYRKIDLHVHTPVSDCFEDKKVTPVDIVKKAIKEGLDGIAITDHNSGLWIDDMKKAAKNKLVVFPGVEISSTGGETTIHIVAVFDKDKSSKDVENLLGDLKIHPDKYGKPAAYTTYSPSEVVDKIAAHGALAIAAHANSRQGVMGGMKGNPRIGVIKNPNLAAVEATPDDFNNAEKKKKRTRVIDFLNGVHTEYRKLAVYQVSDNLDVNTGRHCLSQIGAHYSFFKLDEVTLEGLRQCFCDPDVRIRQKGDFKILRPPRLTRMGISQGFLANQNICFHEGLNSIVGGKGTGKSLIIEFLRFAMNQPCQDKDLLADHNKKLEKRLEFLGKVTLDFELATGGNYRITRTYDGVENPIDCVDSESGEAYQGEIGSLFPVLAYSQNEVIKISEDEAAQLRLIDSFIDTAVYKEEIKKLSSDLKRNDKELAASIKASYEVASYKTQLNTIEEQLKNIGRSLKNKLFDQMKALEKKKSVLQQYLDFHNTMEEKLDESLQYFSSELAIPDIPGELSKDREVKKANKLTKDSIDVAVASVKKTQEEIFENHNKVEAVLSEWIPLFEQKKKEYEEMLTKVGGDKKKLETARRKLNGDREKIQQELGKYTKQLENMTQIQKKRNSLLDQFEAAHKNNYAIRKKMFDSLTKEAQGKLKLGISYAANHANFKNELWALRSGSGIHRTDTDKVVDSLMPRQFVDLVINNDANTLTQKTGLAQLNAEKLVNALNSKEDISEVLALSYSVYPQDIPSIKFKKDDGEYYPISEVSTGQKCTALLIIALSEGIRPVIIDQPEDSLDTTSVYEDIVTKLRGGKEKRQFILTTHNASVGVASDSDNFIVLKSTSSRGAVDCYGAIDREKVKKEVIQHLEGGPLPYDLRHKKYLIKSI